MDKLLKAIEGINFYCINEDEILHKRENGYFLDEWNRVNRQVQGLKEKITYTPQQKAHSDEIHDYVFGKMYRRSGVSELAEYIADDFRLILDSKIVGYSDIWLDRLIDSYMKHKIPCGEA